MAKIVRPLLTGVLAVTPAADAGITKIQILSRGPAFGGFSFPRVGSQALRNAGKGEQYRRLLPVLPTSSPDTACPSDQ